ncbi:hypothetical protein ACROYT_G036322 [Oculina patagonica]
MMYRGAWIGKATLYFYIISWISSVKAGGQCRSHLSVNGETLKGHTFASSLVDSAIECSIKCENEPRCQSYNYVISQKLCELNNRTKDAKPLDLVPDPNRLYMTRWIDRVPLGSIPELPAESCSEIKASEGKEAPSTTYWLLDPVRTGNIIRVHCDMTSEVADFCLEHQCQNSGTCLNGAVHYTCVCGPVWTGPYCETGCIEALGMENSKVPDSSIQASSEFDQGLKASNGRLRSNAAWSAGVSDTHPWFEVDFGNLTAVSAIATQGRPNINQWITEYRISYSYDGLLYAAHKETAANDAKVFSGNSDRSTVVRHELKKAIITRFIRIQPISYNGWISLRAEFYGCKAGPLNKTCSSPLGMESGQIPDLAIVASSRLDQYKGPERSRLNLTNDGLFDGGWTPQYQNTLQFLQIDLGNVTMVTGIVTQGNFKVNWWVKSYTLAYGIVDGNFTAYNNDQEFEGNINREDRVGHILDPPIIARFIKIQPKSWSTYISLRVELFGCNEGFQKPTLQPCVDALGMHTREISDSAITASSTMNQITWGPQNGRLHYLMAGTGTEGSWATAVNDPYQWFQVDMGNWTLVGGVATQGKQDEDEWVSSYSLSSSNGEFFEYVGNASVTKKIFSGNFDRYTVVRHDLDEAIITHYIRIHPETWYGHISMRAEFYGCRTGFDVPVLECMSPLGMKSREIPDEAITATTVLSQFHGPERARLDTVIEGSYTGGWVSFYINLGQWIQVDLGNITKITAVATQGHHDLFHWVTEYYLSYSVNGGPFLSYNDNQVLFGNIDRDTVIGHVLNPPLITRYIRLHPKTWYNYIAMRFELYGCRSGECSVAITVYKGDNILQRLEYYLLSDL